jgi:hypothetical protein
MTTDPKLRAIVDELTRKLTSEGKIIGAGWAGYHLLVIPANAPQVQVDESRNAFYAGAQHLFGSLMSILTDDAEPTEGEILRIARIDEELKLFVAEFKTQHKL